MGRSPAAALGAQSRLGRPGQSVQTCPDRARARPAALTPCRCRLDSRSRPPAPNAPRAAAIQGPAAAPAAGAQSPPVRNARGNSPNALEHGMLVSYRQFTKLGRVREAAIACDTCTCHAHGVAHVVWQCAVRHHVEVWLLLRRPPSRCRTVEQRGARVLPRGDIHPRRARGRRLVLVRIRVLLRTL